MSRRLPKPIPLGNLPSMARNTNDSDDYDDGGGNRRGALIGLVITALLVIAGYYLMTVLRHQGQMEDCLMSGRTNCAPIQALPNE